jgi:hypothetical protein
MTTVTKNFVLTATFSAGFALMVSTPAHAQLRGLTGSTPYVLPVDSRTETISILTVDNTGTAADDVVPKIGGGSYGMAGIPDGLGAIDNGDGTFTLLVNHELGSAAGVVRDHGGKGAFVSKWLVNVNTLNVLYGGDLMQQVYGWDVQREQVNVTTEVASFNRFCSADLPEATAFYDPRDGSGTQARIFMTGEEGGTTGLARAIIVTGADAGKSYNLGKFNLATNGSRQEGVGGWENLLASPFPQSKTVVIGTNDGGTGIMNNSIAVYVGTKQRTGSSEVEKAGLTNGTLQFVNVTGNPIEIVDTTTRATNIVSGTPFTLSSTSSTTFSRPEDGAWNPLNRNQFFFVTTDQLDLVGDGLGTQVGRTRLWRLNFADIMRPELGGTIDLLIDGRTVNGEKVNMFDNIGINQTTGRIMLQEDTGTSVHNAKVWEFDPSTFTGTNTGTLTIIAKHDPARFGDRVGGVTTTATLPFTNDEETSGIIDITSIMRKSRLHLGNPGEAWYISSDQAHYTTGITTEQVEGGQIFVIHQLGSR